MIRQNPVNPCIIESSVDGTNWCPFIDLSKCSNFGSQPGPQFPPHPNGGSKQYCFKLHANGTTLLPLLISSGDTIRLDNANGAGWDGGEFDFGPLWRLPNGDQYVGGLDVGFPTVNGTDPLPTVRHMKLIAGIGSTPVFLELTEGSLITVPGGIEQEQIWLQVNDDPIGNNQGDYDVCVTVTNNGTGVETLIINTPTSNPISMANATELGRSYQLDFSGEINYDTHFTDRLGDAFYITADAWATQELIENGPCLFDVDSEPVYSGTHIYSVTAQGTGEPFSFVWKDNVYTDNSGQITVQITPL